MSTHHPSEHSSSQLIAQFKAARSEQTLEEIQQDIERLRKIKILPPTFANEQLPVSEEEKKRLREEIERLENTIPTYEEPKSVKKWTIDSEDRIVDFTVTECRIDLIYRLKNNMLYSLEECKLIIKEIVAIQQREAKIDLKNLMYLSNFRNEVCFSQPIATDYLGQSGVGGFSDPEAVRKLLFDSDLGGDDDLLRSPYQRQKAQQEHIELIPILKTKDKLDKLLRKINRSIIVLIDNGLRQRKERVLLSAQILSDLEQSQEIVQYLRYEGFPPGKFGGGRSGSNKRG